MKTTTTWPGLTFREKKNNYIVVMTTSKQFVNACKTTLMKLRFKMLVKLRLKSLWNYVTAEKQPKIDELRVGTTKLMNQPKVSLG